jgi:hypothetical protein
LNEIRQICAVNRPFDAVENQAKWQPFCRCGSDAMVAVEKEVLAARHFVSQAGNLKRTIE